MQNVKKILVFLLLKKNLKFFCLSGIYRCKIQCEIAHMSWRLHFFHQFYHNGRESTVNRSLDGSIYPSEKLVPSS
jgi:hypothetical protein